MVLLLGKIKTKKDTLLFNSILINSTRYLPGHDMAAKHILVSVLHPVKEHCDLVLIPVPQDTEQGDHGPDPPESVLKTNNFVIL